MLVACLGHAILKLGRERHCLIAKASDDFAVVKGARRARRSEMFLLADRALDFGLERTASLLLAHFLHPLERLGQEGVVRGRVLVTESWRKRLSAKGSEPGFVLDVLVVVAVLELDHRPENGLGALRVVGSGR